MHIILHMMFYAYYIVPIIIYHIINLINICSFQITHLCIHINQILSPILYLKLMGRVIKIKTYQELRIQTIYITQRIHNQSLEMRFWLHKWWYMIHAYTLINKLIQFMIFNIKYIILLSTSCNWGMREDNTSFM